MEKTTPAPTKPETVAKVIERYRKEIKDMTMRPFAKELGISHTMVRLLENGVNEPSRETMAGWFNSEQEWIYEMAVEIFIARYRNVLTQHRPVTTPTDGKSKYKKLN